jgi:predicted aspartyl protease
LRGAPTQTVEFSKAATVKARLLGSWIVPVSVNGKDADWILDTGANLSLVTESEAARIGLTILPESAIASGSTGKRNRVRVAIGTDVRFGSALLHNVAIVVIADNALPARPARNFWGFRYTIVEKDQYLFKRSGADRTDSRTPPGEPNIFLDGLTPIVEAHHGSSPIQMVVDTGASRTTFYAIFRATLSQEEIGQLRKSKAKSTAVGETIERPVKSQREAAT